MDSELEAKIAKLPVWARELIASLRKQAEPNNNTIRNLHNQLETREKRLRVLESRYEALQMIMEAAAKGEHETAKAYVERILTEYAKEE